MEVELHERSIMGWTRKRTDVHSPAGWRVGPVWAGACCALDIISNSMSSSLLERWRKAESR